MKRPEGFDAPPPTPEPTPDLPREKRAAVTRLRAFRERSALGADAARATPEPVPPGSSAEADAVPTAPVPIVTASPRTPRAERGPRVSPERQAAADLRRAERARRRAEKRELRRFTRRQRHRRAVWWSLGGVVAALTALILTAVFSPLLTLREVRVEGAQRIDPALVVDALDGQLGTPLALLDDGLIREQLDSFTLIRSYTTELAPPGTLIVRITERTPVGLIIRGASFDLVDAAGVVIDSSPERVAGMPIIQVAGDDVESAAFASITEVLFALPADLRAQVDSIAASTRDNVTLQLAGSNQRVEWGSAQRSDHKARVLAALVAIHGGDGPGLYDVSAPGSAVFRRE